MKKFLCLADLHYNYKWDEYGYTDILAELITLEKPTHILIAGDIVESSLVKHGNVYKIIRKNIFRDCDFNIPIIFCLGNHEFAYNSVENVFNRMKMYNGDEYNCYCLDVCSYYDILNTDIRIIGNVLWYDNTMKPNDNCKDDVIEEGWLDSTIINFIPSKYCNICKKQILNHINPNKKHILVTHCVPDIRLNWFSQNMPYSVYNQYSGCVNFLNELTNIEWAICGHTHKRMMGVYNNINCINIGNDYIFKTKDFYYFSFEM